MRLRSRNIDTEAIPTLKNVLTKNPTNFSHHFSGKATVTSKDVKTKVLKSGTSKKKKIVTTDKSILKVEKVAKKSKVVDEVVPPDNWEEVLKILTEYRSKHRAPVDTMGCERVDIANIDQKDARYHIFLALMLSSQTKDEITYQAMTWLREFHSGKLTPQLVVDMKEEDFHHCIRQVGFHNTKVKHIRQASQILIEKYDGDVPNTIEDLLALPGVGPKMGLLALQCAWDINAGIGVDLHVHRITNRLQWNQTKTPEHTRKTLESWLPKVWWRPINPLLVGLGQTLCTANKPRCYACPIAQICPSFDKTSKLPKPGKNAPKIRGIEFTDAKKGEPSLLLEYDSE